jgi:hypothetical protein
MKLIDLVPDAELLCALEPDELGLRMLPALAHLPATPYEPFTLNAFIQSIIAMPGHMRRNGTPRSSRRSQRRGPGWRDQPFSSNLGDTTSPNCTASSAVEPGGLHRSHISVEHLVQDACKRTTSTRNPRRRWALYHRGKYDTAVLEAMKAVEKAVRNAAGPTPSSAAKAFRIRPVPISCAESPTSTPPHVGTCRVLFMAAAPGQAPEAPYQQGGH